MGEKLIHMTARHKRTGDVVDLYYESIAEAKKYNPSLIEFREVEYVREEDEEKHFAKPRTVDDIKRQIFRDKQTDEVKSGRQHTLTRFS